MRRKPFQGILPLVCPRFWSRKRRLCFLTTTGFVTETTKSLILNTLELIYTESVLPLSFQRYRFCPRDSGTTLWTSATNFQFTKHSEPDGCSHRPCSRCRGLTWHVTHVKLTGTLFRQSLPCTAVLRQNGRGQQWTRNAKPSSSHKSRKRTGVRGRPSTPRNVRTKVGCWSNRSAFQPRCNIHDAKRWDVRNERSGGQT